jgi:hypothetical protein
MGNFPRINPGQTETNYVIFRTLGLREGNSRCVLQNTKQKFRHLIATRFYCTKTAGTYRHSLSLMFFLGLISPYIQYESIA